MAEALARKEREILALEAACTRAPRLRSPAARDPDDHAEVSERSNLSLGVRHAASRHRSTQAFRRAS